MTAARAWRQKAQLSSQDAAQAAFEADVIAGFRKPQKALSPKYLYDEAGQKLRAVHANKKGVRYRYYVSRKLVEGRKKDADGWRLPATSRPASAKSGRRWPG